VPAKYIPVPTAECGLIRAALCAAEGMPNELLARDMWCAYLCKKAPLQLPKERGQQLRLPEGWIKGCWKKCQE